MSILKKSEQERLDFIAADVVGGLCAYAVYRAPRIIKQVAIGMGVLAGVGIGIAAQRLVEAQRAAARIAQASELANFQAGPDAGQAF